jgi:hypothetical protein
MPSAPKWDGMNRHQREAAARDAERDQEQRARAAKAKDDAEWGGDDRSSKQKKAEDRKAEQQKRDEEQRRRKLEAEALYEKEVSAAGGVPAKVAKRDAQKEVAHAAVAGSYKDRSRDVTRAPPPPASNLNRVTPAEPAGNDGPQAAGSGGAGADKALAATLPEDRHIGKRARVAFRKFCAEQLPLLKEDRKLRRSQYNDLLWAMWQKCPDNPFVQRAESQADEALRRKWYEDEDSDGEDVAVAR